MIFIENRLPADDSHVISCLISYLKNNNKNKQQQQKKKKTNSKILNCRLLQSVGGALWVKKLRTGERVKIEHVKKYLPHTECRLKDCDKPGDKEYGSYEFTESHCILVHTEVATE